MGRLVSRLFLLAISLFDRLATSPRPDLIFASAPRGATVKGRRPSLSDLPLTVVSTAPGLLGRVDCACSFFVNRATNSEGSAPSGANVARRELVFGLTTMVAP
jgi:hypothetical protein